MQPTTKEIQQEVITLTFFPNMTYAERQKAIGNMVMTEQDSFKSKGLFLVGYKVTRQDENSASILIDYRKR